MGDDGFHHAMFFDAGDEVGSQGGILAGDCGISGVSARQEISDKAWAVMAPHFPVWKGNGRPIMDMRRTVEGHGLVDLPPKKPAELKRSWKIAAIGTDKGDLEVATGEAGLTLLSRHTV